MYVICNLSHAKNTGRDRRCMLNGKNGRLLYQNKLGCVNSILSKYEIRINSLPAVIILQCINTFRKYQGV